MSVEICPEEPRAEAPDVSKVVSASLRVAKRKRTAEDSSARIKTPRTEKSQISRPSYVQALDLEKGVNTAIKNLDSHLLADYIAQKTKRFDDNLTVVELEERRIPGTSLYFYP